MAITRVEDRRGMAIIESGFASISVTPLAIEPDDVLIVGCVLGAENSNVNIAASGDESGPLTEVADLYGNDTDDTNLWVGYSVQGASPDNSISITTSPTLNGNPVIYIVIQYRGADTTSVLDVTATTATGTDTDLGNPPTITPVTAGAKVVAFYGANQSISTAWSTPGNLGNFVQHAYERKRIAAGDVNWTSGAFDPDAVSVGGGTLSDSWAAVTLALRQGPLQPPKLTNTQTFYSPSVTPGEVALTAPLLTNTQSFYAPQVAAGNILAPALFENETVFYSPSIRGPGWYTTDSQDTGWVIDRTSSLFDGAIFDIEIFDGLEAFALSPTTDPNWTKQN